MATRLLLPFPSSSVPLSHLPSRLTRASNYSFSLCLPVLVASPSPSLSPPISFRSGVCSPGLASVYPLGRKLSGRSVFALRIFAESSVFQDVCATALSGGIALSILRFWEETAKLGLFDQKLNRKLVHLSIGLAFMLCWPLFSSGPCGALSASLIPAINIIKMLLLGLGLWKDEAAVKSMSRSGDYRELLKGPLYYAFTIGLASAIYWRTSPTAIAAICNLCAGDGLADIIGRRYGSQKIPYNRGKSIAGSLAMLSAGFIASVGFMSYFSSFGYMEGSWRMVLCFFVVSLASTLVESHPLSTKLDDNLTVPLTSVLVGSALFSDAGAFIN